MKAQGAQGFLEPIDIPMGAGNFFGKKAIVIFLYGELMEGL